VSFYTTVGGGVLLKDKLLDQLNLIIQNFKNVQDQLNTYAFISAVKYVEVVRRYHSHIFRSFEL